MKQILIVDDDSMFHFLNSKILSIANVECKIQSAYDGREAMKMLGEGYTPDFIFLDLDMPHMDGYQFIDNFNKSAFPGKEKVRIVVLTSSESETERQRISKMGVKDYISKPLSEESIRSLGV